jgi:glycosyltransferase involved in cell wall biosynthesis
VLRATCELPGSEVIFVDSASTDRSIEVASQFPIQILQLRPNWPLCVAAGRYTGYRHARGEFVFFIDGDAEADLVWLNKGVQYLRSHPDIGAVAGVLDEEYVTAQGVHVGGKKNVFRQDLSASVIPAKALGGIALYRRAAMEKAGPVNPHLPTGEDDELCMRIRNAGWQLARLEGRMAIKYTEKRDTLYEVLRRCRTSMYDYGAVVRYSALYGAGIQYSLEMIPYVLSFLAILLVLLVATPIFVYLGLTWFLLGGLGLGAILLVLRKGNVKNAILAIAVRAVSAYRTIRSFLVTKTQPIEAYPTDVIRVK